MGINELRYLAEICVEIMFLGMFFFNYLHFEPGTGHIWSGPPKLVQKCWIFQFFFMNFRLFMWTRWEETVDNHGGNFLPPPNTRKVASDLDFEVGAGGIR